ncbi:sensor histidine kinase [Planosporangium flavigriseum]|nr:sensor histidine kinase [Planosporangium flavigriseum]
MVDPSVAGHLRGGVARLWSVRTQLLAPILVAMLGLGVLGSVQTADSVASARDATRAQVVASTATATVRLTHELERELAEMVALRQRGGRAGVQLVVAQRVRTDGAIKRYRDTLEAAMRTAPALEAQLTAADVQLDRLIVARSLSNPGSPSDSLPDPIFHDITSALLAVADALPSQLRDPDLAAAAREVAALAAVEHFHALERDLLRTVFSRGSLQGNDLIELARIDSARQQREAEFARVSESGARERYRRVVTGADVERAAQRRDAVFTGDPAALKVDADAWYVAQSGTIRKVNLVGLALADQLDRRAADIAASATRRAWLTATGTISLGLVALAAAVVLAVRTSRRLRRLRAAALTVARHELPDTIAKVMAGASVEETFTRDSEAADITRRIAASEDEVGEVADAFSSVHHTALRLASDQAELRLDMARMAETFARRIRTLVTRQLRLLDEFERDETDPEALSRFFALDHLATRLRRNGENLLVLAGGEPGRQVTGAFPLTAVITAAASEIENFARVEAQAMDAAVVGPVVGDLVHLLAELLENATSFSPPDKPVRVDARHTIDGMVLRVHDSGIGLTPARLAEVNARLSERAARLSSAAAGTMGLYVVARLAARHGITVELHATASGTVAYVRLPLDVLAPLQAVQGVDGMPRASTGAVRSEAAVQRIGTGASPTGKSQAGSGGLRVPASVAAATSLGAPFPAPAAPAAPGAPSASEVPAPAIPAIVRGSASLHEGLPRRRPGAQLGGEPLTVPMPAPRAPIDPETVRTRLSALAEGVSAAMRQNSEPRTAAESPTAARDR